MTNTNPCPRCVTGFVHSHFGVPCCLMCGYDPDGAQPADFERVAAEGLRPPTPQDTYYYQHREKWAGYDAKKRERRRLAAAL